MKKIFVFILLFALNMQITFAKNSDKDYTINFNGDKYHLLYSIKSKDFGGYLNEYYKKGETYNIWTEMVAVHHFPNAYSPIDRIKDFKDYLGSMHVPSSLTFDDKKNTAMIDFVMITEHKMPIVLEFNIFKYEKSKKCGSIAFQYAKRYAATTTLQIEEIKKDFEKNRKHLIKQVKNAGIPQVITENIDKCISASDVRKNSESKENISDGNITAENFEKKEEQIVEQNTDKKEMTSNNNTESNSTAETITQKDDITVNHKKEVIVEQDKKLQESDNSEIDTEQKPTEIKESDNKTNSDEQKSAEKKNENVKEAVSKTTETKDSEKNIVNNVPKNEQTATDSVKSKKQKKVKEVSYEVVNNKSDYYAKARTEKDLKAEIKQKRIKQKELIKQKKIKAKEALKQEKINKKEAAIKAKEDKKQKLLDKKQEKKDAKELKKQYKKQAIADKREEKLSIKENKRLEKIQEKQAKRDIKEEKREKKIKAKKQAKIDKIQSKIDKLNEKKSNI